MKKVFVNFRFNEKQKAELEQLCPEFSFVYEEAADARIIIGNYPVSKLQKFRQLEWIQTSAVGVDAYIRKGVLKDDTVLTNAVDVHTIEVAEHLLGVILMMIKRLHTYRDYQSDHLWKDAGKVKEISRLRVCIVGLGDIGSHLARLLKSLGVYVIGVKRSRINKPDYVDELYLSEQLKEAISNVDVVVSVIPGNSANRHLFDLDTFKAMRRDCILINAGRGNLYSEEVLLQVLKEQIIEAVGTDVFETEPLPADSPLWDYPNLLITPHVAGGYHLSSASDRFFELAKDNLLRYHEGKKLRNIVEEREWNR